MTSSSTITRFYASHIHELKRAKIVKKIEALYWDEYQMSAVIFKLMVSFIANILTCRNDFAV